MEQENNQVKTNLVDLRLLLNDLLHMARRLLWLGAILVLLFGALFGWNRHRNYSPVYNATATFTITVTNPLYSGVKAYNAAAAEQMAETFPYIL